MGIVDLSCIIYGNNGSDFNIPEDAFDDGDENDLVVEDEDCVTELGCGEAILEVNVVKGKKYNQKAVVGKHYVKSNYSWDGIDFYINDESQELGFYDALKEKDNDAIWQPTKNLNTIGIDRVSKGCSIWIRTISFPAYQRYMSKDSTANLLNDDLIMVAGNLGVKWKGLTKLEVFNRIRRELQKMGFDLDLDLSLPTFIKMTWYTNMTRLAPYKDYLGVIIKDAVGVDYTGWDIFDDGENDDYGTTDIRIVKWFWKGKILYDINGWPGDNESGGIFMDGKLVISNSDRDLVATKKCPKDLKSVLDKFASIREN